MATTTDDSKAPSSWRTYVVLVAAAAMLAALYYATFFPSEYVLRSRAGIAFADGSDYYNLLKEGHFWECLTPATPHDVEHRRKTLHHVTYLLFSDGVQRVAGVTGVSEVAKVWAAPALLGGLNFVLAFLLFQRRFGTAFAWPGALTFALVPATWVYAAIPDTWPLTSAAVLAVLLMRDLPMARWKIALLIAVFALNNFLSLLLIALLKDDRLSLRGQFLQLLKLGLIALGAWLGLLTVLGLVLSPDFLPQNFLDYTVHFRTRMAQNLSIFNPARYVYTAVNMGVVAFVLNQPYLNFGSTAVLDSARSVPLGTLAVLCYALIAVFTVRAQFPRVVADVRQAGWLAAVSGDFLYVALSLLAAGLALYYESFLYAGLVLPILLLYALRALSGVRWGLTVMRVAAIVLALNSAQQMYRFRELAELRMRGAPAQTRVWPHAADVDTRWPAASLTRSSQIARPSR
jgi:hypothetical protein